MLPECKCGHLQAVHEYDIDVYPRKSTFCRFHDCECRQYIELIGVSEQMREALDKLSNLEVMIEQ